MSETRPDLRRRLRGAHRLALALGSLALALGAALAWSLARGPGAAPPPPSLDPALRQAALEEFLAANPNIYDSFPDPDVGRILQRRKTSQLASTNELGLREDRIPLPKVPGFVRVVLLGDSYVFGYGEDADRRMGVFLQELLEQHARQGREIECLHVGVVSWNIRSETAYLRRFLHELQPDLVLHVVVANDLDDVGGVRGVGTQTATYSPQVRQRASGVIRTDYPIQELSITQRNWLVEGLDHESRSRYAQAAVDLAGLATAVEASGARYQLVNYWEVATMQAAGELLCAGLRDDQVLHLSSREFRGHDDIVVSRTDKHWNETGHRAVARFLFGAILERDLLPELELRDDPDARQWMLDFHAAGLAATDRSRARKKIDIGSSLTFPCDERSELRQIHGGVNRKGRVTPYASLILARGDATELVVAGQCLPAPQLDGAVLTIHADEFPVGQLTLAAGQPAELRVALPAEVRERDYFSVRFEASDYVYATDPEQTCHSFQLTRVAAE